MNATILDKFVDPLAEIMTVDAARKIAALRPDEVYLNADAADELGASAGDSIRIFVGSTSALCNSERSELSDPDTRLNDSGCLPAPGATGAPDPLATSPSSPASCCASGLFLARSSRMRARASLIATMRR